MAKLAFQCILALLVCAHLSNSYPVKPWNDKTDGRLVLKSVEDVKTVKNVDSSVSKGESSEGGKGDKEKVVKGEDDKSGKGEEVREKKKEEDNEVKPKEEEKDEKITGNEGTGVAKSGKCAKVKCLQTPQEVECKVHPVPGPFAAMIMDCCPIHNCRRPDGSTYFHYGFEIEGDSPSKAIMATSEQNSNGRIPFPMQFQQGAVNPQTQLPGPPPSVFAFNFGRPSPFQQRGPQQPFPFQFQGPFGMPHFSPQSNIRGPQPSTSFTAVTFTDNSIDRSARSAGQPQEQFSAFPGPFSRPDVGAPFGFEPAIRERRNIDFGQGYSGVVPMRPAGFSPGGPAASFANF